MREQREHAEACAREAYHGEEHHRLHGHGDAVVARHVQRERARATAAAAASTTAQGARAGEVGLVRAVV